MSVKVYVPRDSAALSMGADQVAEAIVQEAGSRGVDVQLVRNGSRGMLWLEPLIEVGVGASQSVPWRVADGDAARSRAEH